MATSSDGVAVVRPVRALVVPGAGLGSRPLPAGPEDVPGWRAEVIAAVRARACLRADDEDPADAMAVSGAVADGLTREEYIIARPWGQLRAIVVRPAEPAGGSWPAVLVCPGRNAVVEQVTGSEPPDYPDRDVAARFASAGLTTLTLDYGFDGSVDQRRLYGRDEAAVLAQLYAVVGRSLLAELAADAVAAFRWLGRQPWVRPGEAGLFGHSLGGAVALHAALTMDQPPPLCTASHLGSYRVIGYGHPALLLPGIARDADLPDLYAALAPVPLQVQFGLCDNQLDPADAQAAGERIKAVYRLAGAEANADVRAEPMGHGTATEPAIEFFGASLRGGDPPHPPRLRPFKALSASRPFPSVPLLRLGGWYTSLDQLPAPRPAFPPISLAPAILLRKDARRLRTAVLPAVPDPVARAAILTDAVRLFATGTVQCGGLGEQSAAGFRTALWRSAGLPAALVDRWCAMLAERLAAALESAPVGSPAPFLTLVSLPANTFTCLESLLAALWAGDVTWVRPSTREPLSALRMVSALTQAGWPGELIGFYPTRPSLLPVLAAITDRQIVYGGAELAAAIGEGPGVELHGPMRACAVVAEDADPDETAAALLPLVASDGGRFCTTVRAIFCRTDPTPLAERLAALLDAIPFPPGACGLPLAASPDASQAAAMAAAVTSRLGAGDRVVTGRPLLSRLGGQSFLAPTLVRLADTSPVGGPEWGQPPLLGFEAPFPLATITRVTGEQEARLTDAADLTYRLAGRPGSASGTGGLR